MSNEEEFKCEIGCPEGECECIELADTDSEGEMEFDSPVAALYNEDDENICQVLTNMKDMIDSRLDVQNKVLNKIAKTLEKLCADKSKLS